MSKLDKLKELTKIQCSDGNWNYDPYMQGLANGMILAVAVMEGKTPKYLEMPDGWLCDIKGSKLPKPLVTKQYE